MDFDGVLSTLQGTIYSLGSRGLLNNQGSLQSVVEALEDITRNLSDEDKLRVVFFMVLNTNFLVSEKLKDDKFVGLITNITPPMDKEYLVLYAYHLNLQLQLFKVIENCQGSLSLELLDIILTKLHEPDFHRDDFGLEYFYQLWKSIFVKICKINRKLHVNDGLTFFVFSFACICELILKILADSVRLKGLEKTTALHLYYFFKSVLFCLILNKNSDLSDDPIFELSIKSDDEEDNLIENPLEICIDAIFNTVYEIIKNCEFDLELPFSDCHFDFDSKNSAQLLIGDLIHRILEEVKDYNVSSDVLNCLSVLAIDKFTRAGLDEIISNVRNGNKEWFSVLVKYSVFTEEELVKCMVDCINLASSEDLNIILSRSYECIYRGEHENMDSMKELFFTVLKKIPDYSEWLEKVFSNYIPDLLKTPHTQDDLIEIFNKISKDKNVPNCELVSLCIQSPLETIKKICHLAVYGSQHYKDVIEVLKLLKHACSLPSSCNGFTFLDYVLFKCLFLEEFTDKEKQSFINLIVHMGRENLLGSFFIRNLLKTLKEHLENIAFEKAVLCLEIINASLKLKVFVIDEAAFLVFMSQVLEHFTWDLNTFSTIKADGRDLVVFIVATVINGLESEKNDPAYQWARDEILKSSEVNHSCFCDFWFRFGSNWPNSGKFTSCILALAHSRHETTELRKFLINADQPLEVKNSIVLSLALLLPVLAFRELNVIFHELIIVWESMNSWKSEAEVYCDLLDIFGSSMYLLTLKLKEQETFSCYEYCLRNIGRMAKQACPKMNGTSLVRALEKIFFVLITIEEEEKRRCCWMTVLPVLLEFFDWVKKRNVMETHGNEIRNLLDLLELKDVAETLIKRLD